MPLSWNEIKDRALNFSHDGRMNHPKTLKPNHFGTRSSQYLASAIPRSAASNTKVTNKRPICRRATGQDPNSSNPDSRGMRF